MALSFLLRLRKKLTVMGMMGHTQGVNNATNPPKKPAMKIAHREMSVGTSVVPKLCSLSMTGVHKSPEMLSLAGAGVSATSATGVSSADVAGVVALATAATSPLNENSTGVGGKQFSSLHAPYSR